LLNQQLATLMIVDDRSVPGRRLLRYPGALLSRNTLAPQETGWVATDSRSHSLDR
jgi:hypothetical protein